ncbi:hypothetical protein HG535_0E02690 [Zygotorulaspora mrakii]|uniref:DNA polymerase gamma n=1 Tax=Zygotorulaspora mrakii TaxID=42260 RepID=A0A7H9B3E2_ZYGMR|nr:uncharacterized protein HG535_0E02690 [Zygotorulaspora mrakii]QLG73185.1 hypothetical protein HG535_0E02690 [Zygotorulaspora mrakii]
MQKQRLMRNCKVRSFFAAEVGALARDGEICHVRMIAGKEHRLRLYRYRGYSTKARTAGSTGSAAADEYVGGFKEPPRINPVGIQYLSESLHRQLFGNKKNSQREDLLSPEKKRTLVNLAKQSLGSFDLLGKKTCITEPISFELPKLQGTSLDEHFQKLGHFASEPYKTMALKKFTSLVARPSEWIKRPGWTRYEPGKAPENVGWPLEDTMVFDVETLYKISPYPTLAVAVTSKAWYLWCSPYICGNNSVEHLIPMDTTKKSRLVIGHNVAYDRARVLEEYNFENSKAFFIDTQSLHIASSGLCSRQRPRFMKTKKYLGFHSDERKKTENDVDLASEHDPSSSEALLQNLEDDPWLGVSAMNSLRDVAFFHCGIRMDKEPRNFFSSTDRNIVVENFNHLVNYCATDVETTSRVFDKVMPLFLQKCPHPVSFGALRFLSSCILPTRHSEWNDYITRCEKIYQESKKKIEDKIIEIIERTIKLANDDKSMDYIKNDPWLCQLDWTVKPTKITKKGTPAKNQKFPGLPEWYRSLFQNKTATRPSITIRSRSIPIFFRLSWEGYPCVWTDNDGWCFPVPVNMVEKFKNKNYFIASKESTDYYLQSISGVGSSVDKNRALFKVPHPNGPQFNCTTLLSKPYIHFFEKGILSSESDLAHEALHMNSSGSYWMSSRERIGSQFVVPQNRFPNQFKDLSSTKSLKSKKDLGIIIPGIIPMGTVTRRAVEKTWLTASNAKPNRVGSELKAQVKAPDGYCFVGADVDSEELWIASLVGDSVFNIHGGTAIGWMCLEGTKNEGTDLHTKTAEILGCTRNEAKIFNYGRIYGAGVKFAAQLLKRFNHSLTEEQAKDTAKKLYESTKGKTKRSKIFKKFWYGGSESILFNKLESIAEQDEPRTPVLGCGITASLLKKNLGTNSFLPSRINWTIQSSGVDYLHLLICSMNYLITKYNIDARLCLSIHDEIRYLVADKDKYRAAMALQVSNIWTRAIFCEQLGIDDLSQNCAFFSAVDIDHVMRKEVDMSCITPSNTNSIPHGESFTINELLKIPEGDLKESVNNVMDISKFPSHYREPVFSKYNKAYKKDFLNFFLKMQIQNAKWKVDALEAEYIRVKTSQDFQKDGLSASFGLLDYLKDIEEGKKQRVSIMAQAPFKDFDEYHMSCNDKKLSKACSSSQQKDSTSILDDSSKTNNDPSSKATQDSLIIEELHRANSADIFSTFPESAVKRKKKYTSNNAGSGRRSRKGPAGRKVYDDFYDSSSASAKRVSTIKVPIDEVVEDVLSCTRDTNREALNHISKASHKAKRRGTRTENHSESSNYYRERVLSENTGGVSNIHRSRNEELQSSKVH